MFAKPNNPIPHNSKRGAKNGGAVDHFAFICAIIIIGLGIIQLFMPIFAAPLTGLDNGIGSQIIGLLWSLLGGLLAVGGILRVRVLTIFAAEFLLLLGLAALILIFIRQVEPIALLVHGAVAFVGLINSGLARLVDKAEIKRELVIAREIEKAHTIEKGKEEGNNASANFGP